MSEVARKRTPLLRRAQRRIVRLIVEAFFRTVSHIAQLLPSGRAVKKDVEVIRDLRYRETGLTEHLLDIYRPQNRQGPLPVIFYVHGGGFSLLSKETHWIFGYSFARRGYVVVNINYRLAPRYLFPAGAQDVAHAWAWVQQHIADYGGDPTRVAFAGESAGANLATVLTIASCSPRPEPWAREVYELNRPPLAVLPACGLFQVSDSGRFHREKRVGSFISARLADLMESYLGGLVDGDARAYELADPLVIIEQAQQWERPLPPFFLPVGTADPVLNDTQRLEAALKRSGVTQVTKYYAGQPHAFHAFHFLPQARACWKDTDDFLQRFFPSVTEAARAAS